MDTMDEVGIAPLPGDEDPGGPGTEMPGSRGKPRVQSVSRAASILFCVAESESGVTAAEIRSRTGLPTQATYHLLQTLQALGLLRRSNTNSYVLGLRVGDLIDGFRRHFSCPEELRALVRRVAERTGETSYASGWYDGDLVSLAVETGSNPVHASAGSRHLGGHVHARASGKLLLALSGEVLQRAFFAAATLEPLTPNTLTSAEALREEFREILAQGYALDREEFAIGLSCLAVPLRVAGETFALCVSAPTERLNRNFEAILARLNAEIAALR